MWQMKEHKLSSLNKHICRKLYRLFLFQLEKRRNYFGKNFIQQKLISFNVSIASPIFWSSRLSGHFF